MKYNSKRQKQERKREFCCNQLQHFTTPTLQHYYIPCFLILLYNAVRVMPNTRAVWLTLPLFSSRDCKMNCFSISSRVTGFSVLGFTAGDPISNSAERITSLSLRITARSMVC